MTMPPVPTAEQAREIRNATHHQSQTKGEAWNASAKRLWEGVVPEFQWRALKASGICVLPLPANFADQERWMRAMVRLVRVAVRNGRRRDLESLFLALTGVRGEDGGEEILHDGIVHPDVLSTVIEWRMALNTHEEKAGYLPESGLMAFVEVQLALAVYETVVRDALVFLESLARAAAGQPARFWDHLIVPRGKGRFGTPYADQALDQAQQAVKALGRRRGWNRSDQQALTQMLDHLARVASWKGVSELRAIRDTMSHGKFQVDPGGRIVFDTIDHWVVNLFSPTPRGRRGYRPHTAKYRAIDLPSARAFTEGACALAVVFWAAYEDFRMALVSGPKMGATPPDAAKVTAAKGQLVKVDPRTKRKIIAAERAAWKKARDRIKIQVVSSRPASPPKAEK